MDAVEFIRDIKRWLETTGQECFMIYSRTDPDSTVERIESWAEEHPIKTRQSEFLKHYPDAIISGKDGVLEIDPCSMERSLYKLAVSNKCSGDCNACRKMYWFTEVE